MEYDYEQRWGEQPPWDPDQWTTSEPVWVSCDAEDADHQCVEWTISNYDLSSWNGTLGSLGPPVHGCLAFPWVKGEVVTVHRHVEANFLIKVEYIDKGETCP